ncbi:P-loop containing nucleoside triphosphate hydrolase protein [Dactylonectria estremocensis]|uniref:P-loop containing nucleoside triphosphate hydrolase protein n=1 Tax=Dactylonectria estremocensis TaxID=1079267 RepID=A0A9P9F9S4_9HYPO|nr:P-loop containing nucleoside triphosphate hydrolase protein [Dactylonectria estremocensis]
MQTNSKIAGACMRLGVPGHGPQVEGFSGSHQISSSMPMEEMEYEPDSSIGEICEAKAIWTMTKDYCDCCVAWTEEKPFGKNPDEAQITREARDSYAVVCGYHVFGDSWRIHQLWINNPELKAVLVNLLDDYPAVDCKAANMHFKRPFLPFLHCWADFLRLVENEIEVVARENLELLRRILDNELKDMFKEVQAFQDTGYVSFDNIPLIFEPGDIMLNQETKSQCAALLREVTTVQNVEAQDTCQRLRISQLDWDGGQCGVRESTWQIHHYTGTRRLTDMDIMPLKLHPSSVSITEHITAKGRVFEGLRSNQFLSYNGKARDMQRATSSHDWGEGTMTQMVERVMIDAKYYHDHEGGRPEMLHPLEGLDPRNVVPKTPRKVVIEGHQISASNKSFHHVGGEHYETDYRLKKPDYSPLTDRQCLLAVPVVLGFALDSKIWCKFSVDCLAPISWNTKAINNLVIKEAEKKLILSFVAATNAAGFDDFVPGKGKGMVMLLAGPPGTGKTLTAETVSEHVKRPLYKLGVSDLGTKVNDVERNLKHALKRCALWDAILLVDEADVFLEARTTDSLERNQMVSIFLRLLEYYDGIMILTTNRHLTLDPAFESRIDVIIGFTELDEPSRSKIWHNFLQTVDGGDDLGEDIVAMIASVPLNGRQIKSAVKTAHVLAAGEGVPLNAEHIRTVVDLRNKATMLLGGAALV